MLSTQVKGKHKAQKPGIKFSMSPKKSTRMTRNEKQRSQRDKKSKAKKLHQENKKNKAVLRG